MRLADLASSLSCGHDVAIVDNFARRNADIELEAESLTPITPLGTRLAAWRELTGREIAFHRFDVAVHYRELLDLLIEWQPDAVVHFAEQRAAPYSMKSSWHKRYTVSNNLNATHNLLAAIVEAELDAQSCTSARWASTATAPPAMKIPEGYLRVKIETDDGERDRAGDPLPGQPGLVYHMTKTQDQLLFAYYNKNDGIRVTDLHQGIVWGTQTAETGLDERLINRFDYDGDYGTVLNRFLMQAAIGYPLTVHGTGGQTRAFIHIQDTVRCIQLAIENPPERGERVRVFNQMTETHRVIDLAKLVSSLTGAEIDHVENPRNEAAENDLFVENGQLLELGLEPIRLQDDLLSEVTEIAGQVRRPLRLERSPASRSGCRSLGCRRRRRRSPPRRRSARDQALALELRLRLLERDVGRRQDHVRARRGRRRRPARRARGRSRAASSKASWKCCLVVGLAGADGRVVELVELGHVGVGDLVLALVRDPDDHCACSWLAPRLAGGADALSPAVAARAACPLPSPAPSSPAGARPPTPSSAFIFASSASTSLVLESCLSWRSMSSSPGAELGQVLERAGGLELLDGVGARLHVLGLVERALHRQADVGHLLADTGRRLGDPDLGLGGRVLGLDDLLLGAELLDLRAQLLLGLGHLLLLLLELRDLRVERLQLGLDDVLALQRRPGEVLVAGGERLARLRVELDDLLLELLLLQLEPLLRRDDVGDPLLDVLEQLDLLLVAVSSVSDGSSARSSSFEILALTTVDMRPERPGIASSLAVGWTEHY